MVIPKRAFFFWGSQPMSWLRYMTLYSFKTLNPDWRVQLFVSDNKVTERYWTTPNYQDFHSYEGKDYTDQVADLGVEIIEWKLEARDIQLIGPSHQSNFFKWSQLGNQGGLFSDMDILFVRPLDEWYGQYGSCRIAIPFCGYFLIGFMGSEANSDFFKSVYEAAYLTYDSSRYQSAGVSALYNALQVSVEGDSPSQETFDLAKSNLEKLYCNSREDRINRRANFVQTHYGDFDHQLIYPWLHQDAHFYFENTDLPRSDCLGLHWYAGGKIAQQHNNTLTESNWRKYPCVITSSIERVFGGSL